MLTFVEIAAHLRPRWIVWENVPGCLSSGGGRDFGALLGSLVHLGYGCAWRVLDAQWFGVPQRRRRVFLVGCLGDWTAAAKVLFERESLCGHPPSREQARQGAAADAGGGAKGGCYWNGEQIAAALTRKGCDDRMPDKERLFAVMQPQGFRWQNNRDRLQSDEAVSALRASQGASGFHEMNHPVVVQPIAFANRTRDGINVPEVMAGGVVPALTNPGNGGRSDAINVAVPFRKSKRAQSSTDDETWVQAQQANTLNQFDTGERDTHAVAFNWQNGGGYGNANEGLGITVEGTGPLQRCNTPAVAVGVDLYNQEITGQVHCPLRTAGGHGAPAVAHSLRAEGFDASEDGTGRGTPLVPSTPMTVRRLTPREAERLQGFQDDFTLIPYRNKAAELCPDGPRYRALGNSMAVPCMRWIGERIAAVESGDDQRAAPGHP